MSGEPSSRKRNSRLRFPSISKAEEATLIQVLKAAIKAHNALDDAAISDEELEQRQKQVLELIIPIAARLAASSAHYMAGRNMAMVGTGDENPSRQEIRNALSEPERYSRFYPEVMRAGARTMIGLTQSLWPSKLAVILDASLGELEAGRASKMLTPEPREAARSKGSLADRKRLALCVACEVEFQKAANPGSSEEQAVSKVTGQTRAGYRTEGLPPLIPLRWVSWHAIVNPKFGLLAFARQHFRRELAEAAEAGRLLRSGEANHLERTEFFKFRADYLRFSSAAWSAIWARAAGADPKAKPRRVRKSRKAKSPKAKSRKARK